MTELKENDGKSTGRNSKGQFVKGNSCGVQFEPGNNANPKGRRDAISDLIRRALDAEDGKIKKELTEKLIVNAQIYDGDDFLKYFDRIVDRTEGKATQPTADVSDTWEKFLEGVFEDKQE